MADAAKSDEIEDVLSSIRRLVSENQHPKREAETLSDMELGASHSNGAPQEDPQTRAKKLILTPALRVTDPEDPWVQITPKATEDSQEDAGASGPLQHADESDWADALLARGATDATEGSEAPLGGDADVQPGQGNDRATGNADVVADKIQQDLSQDSLDGDPDATESDEMGQPMATNAGDADVPLSFIRSTSSVRDYEPEEGDPGFSDTSLPTAMRDLAQFRATQEDVADSDATREDAAASEDAGADNGPVKPGLDTARVRVEIVKAVIADELQGGAGDDEATTQKKDAHDEIGAEVEPQATDRHARGATADSAAEGQEPTDNVTDFLATAPDKKGLSSSEPGVEDLGEVPFTFPDDGDSFVDEEALREVIAEVVREELQGEMGVRITRNIRKLVRREIRMALAAQEIE